jgi:NTE family protein
MILRKKESKIMRDGNGSSWTPAQTVLVLQGGGALGAYQAGVYQGLHEAGIEPDWVIGTSIGGINGAIIAGNKPEDRVGALIEFWSRVGHQPLMDENWPTNAFLGVLGNFNTVTRGVPGLFQAQSECGLGPACAGGRPGSVVLYDRTAA